MKLSSCVGGTLYKAVRAIRGAKLKKPHSIELKSRLIKVVRLDERNYYNWGNFLAKGAMPRQNESKLL